MAGTLVTAARKLIYVQGAQFLSAVSEELIQRLGATLNHIALFQHSEKQFFLNGDYSKVTVPQTGADGLVVFEFDAEIIDVIMFNLVAGSAGTTELDVKLATDPGGSFTSIFSTTPKIASTAASNSWVSVGDTVTGCTAPVLSTTDVNAKDALRLDLITHMTGAQNCGVLIHYRPR